MTNMTKLIPLVTIHCALSDKNKYKALWPWCFSSIKHGRMASEEKDNKVKFKLTNVKNKLHLVNVEQTVTNLVVQN